MILRGDVYYADLGSGIGSEQEGERPVIIIQNNIGNRFSPTVIVAPFTSKNKGDLPTHEIIHLENMELSIILFEQIRCIDKSRLKNKIAHYSGNIDSINDKIKISLGL